MERLGDMLRERIPAASFALLIGSARDGRVPPGGDVDLAFYLYERPTLDFYTRVEQTVEELVSGITCDVGVLNEAEPVYRFEALKGRLFFVREPEVYARFFSLTCREYESQMADYERQRRYRLEAQRAG